MRASVLPFLFALPLAAGGLRVVAVERVGWPPYEDDRRLYRLRGDEAVRPGDLLNLSRPGEPRSPGRLRVMAVEPGRVSAQLESRGALYPLVGDQAVPRQHLPLPGFPAVAPLPDLRVPTVAEPASPPAQAPEVRPAAAPRRIDSIFFLEGDASLSPKGQDKLRLAVAAEGARGRWILAVPENRVLPERVREQRVQALRRALAALGVAAPEVRTVPRGEGERGDVIHLDRP